MEDHIGTFGAATGGKAISIDGGKGITVNGVRATNVAGDCVDVYTDLPANGNIPDAITLNDIGCTNVGLPTTSGGQAGISVDNAKYVYINNPNINTTSHTNINPSSGIVVGDSEASVWVTGGVLQNLANAGVQVSAATLFHMTGTEILSAQNQGVVVIGAIPDLRLSNILVKNSVLAGTSNNRAFDLESLTGSVDVHNVTIQDDHTPPNGDEFYTYDLHQARGIIDGVSGYIPHGSLGFNFQLDTASDPETNVLKRNLSSPSSSTSTRPNCNSATEGLTWYTYGSSSADSKYQICAYSSGTLSWQNH